MVKAAGVDDTVEACNSVVQRRMQHAECTQRPAQRSARACKRRAIAGREKARRYEPQQIRRNEMAQMPTRHRTGHLVRTLDGYSVVISVSVCACSARVPTTWDDTISERRNEDECMHIPELHQPLGRRLGGHCVGLHHDDAHAVEDDARLGRRAVAQPGRHVDAAVDGVTRKRCLTRCAPPPRRTARAAVTPAAAVCAAVTRAAVTCATVASAPASPATPPDSHTEGAALVARPNRPCIWTHHFTATPATLAPPPISFSARLLLFALLPCIFVLDLLLAIFTVALTRPAPRNRPRHACRLLAVQPKH
eukprot:6175049-Pleurochrysis_carterae.AAC.8